MPHAYLPSRAAYSRLLCCVVSLLTVAALRAEGPLHERIDCAIAAGLPDFASHAAPPAGDAEFLRRVYLDLAGTIPTAAETRAFLDDSSPTKREQLIDQLLASPDFARHMQRTFDVFLMERRADKHVPRAAWQEYLRSSFADNKPLDQLVRELLSDDGSDPAKLPLAKFFLDREGEPHLITRDIGRLFLGMNYECAQCHDHPVVSTYLQADYYGIFAFFNRSSLLIPKGKRQGVLTEKAEGEASFQSVFDPKKTTRTSGPHLPGAKPISEPKVAKGKGYQAKPAADGRQIPEFSRRAQLAPLLASDDNPRFRRTLANRLWALLMGRGLVHPLDFDHDDNPPSHPELLALLGDELKAMKYDVRAFLRELALSQTYQRSSEPPTGEQAAVDRFTVALLKPLTAEQLAQSLLQATGMTDVERTTLGKKATEPALQAKLAGSFNAVVATFATAPGRPADKGFEPSLEKTLFMTNGSVVRTWLTPAPAGNLTGRLGKLNDAAAVADELYVSVLTRRPSVDEQREVAEYLKDRTSDRPAALQELVWALLTAAEFHFNH